MIELMHWDWAEHKEHCYVSNPGLYATWPLLVDHTCRSGSHPVDVAIIIKNSTQKTSQNMIQILVQEI